MVGGVPIQAKLGPRRMTYHHQEDRGHNIGRSYGYMADSLTTKPQDAVLRILGTILFCLVLALPVKSARAESIARQWNEVLLEAIRNDYARPTVHARNLYHVSAAMWDAWAAYDAEAAGVFFTEKIAVHDIAEARRQAISYAVYRILVHRFAKSPGAEETLPLVHQQMEQLGYDPDVRAVDISSPAGLGNKIAEIIIGFGHSDGANETEEYRAPDYLSANRFHPLIPKLVGNSGLYKVNNWQPLALELFVDQAGNQLTKPPEFLGPHWGDVTAFSLSEEDLDIYTRDNVAYRVFHDPGPPPLMGTDTDAEYHDGFMQVVMLSSLLDPTQGEMIDISPNARGNNSLGANDGHGRDLNPRTQQPYVPQMVPAGDYYCVLAEFWADGPDFETPPGHWFGIANTVSDHPQLRKRLAGKGKELGPLEWDVKLYLALGGAMHDAAIAAWSVKGWYDYVRPISAVRYMAGWGQRDDPD